MHGELAQNLALVIGAGLEKGDGDIKTTVADFFGKIVVLAGADLHMDVFMRTGKGLERRRHHVVEEILGEAEADGRRRRGRAERKGGFVVEGNDAAGIGDEGLAGFGRHQTAALADEERGAGLLLQLLELHADCRLRAAELDRRAGEAAKIGSRHHGA